MDPIATIQGLASGINFRDLADQIIEAERAPIRAVESRILDLQRRTSAWDAFRAYVTKLDDAVEGLADGKAFQTYTTSVTGDGITALAGSGAAPGNYSVEVLQLATREKLGSDEFASRTEALGLSGEFVIGGRTVSVEAEDSLDDIVQTLNAANSGTSRSGVSAAVLQLGEGRFKLTLTANETGADGIDLVDGPDGVLRSLGVLDDTVVTKHASSNGALSDHYADKTSAVQTLMSLIGPPAAGAVTIGTTVVTLDLSSMSLEDVAEAINDAATAQSTNVSATVVEEVDDQGDTTYRLDISGATTFADENRILEALGVLEGGRGATTQEVQSNAFTDGDGSTTATAGSRLVDLWVGGGSAGAQAGDTLTISGTRGDGTAFTRTFTIGATDTLQDLVDDLNDPTDGLQSGSRTATASISADGRLTLTDDLTGNSQLSLSIVANNEGGGVLDFGSFETSQAGFNREITAGQDAHLLLDGAFVTNSTNTFTDVVKGLTLTATSVTSTPASIGVELNSGGIVASVKGVVDAFNELSDFISDQFSGAGADDGVSDRPLAGDSVLRNMRTQMRIALEASVDAAVGGAYQRLSDLGIEVNKEGRYEFDSKALKEALENDPSGVQRLLGVFGEGSASGLKYVSSGDDTRSGTYAVEITQLATRASLTGAGFGGTYVDDGTADTLTVRDVGSGYEYDIALTNGMTLAEIVDAMNTAFATRVTHQVQGSTALYGDAVGTPVTESTLLQDLYDAGGTSLGVADGDTFSVSGTRSNGSSFFFDVSVTDVTTQTLGDLTDAIRDEIGSDVSLTVVDGKITVTADDPGASLFSLSVSSDNLGGGSLSFGSFDVVSKGRGVSALTASDEGGELKLEHTDYGSLAGFEVSFTGGGSDGSASLGLAAGTYNGLDVAGTIGGFAATGKGQLLTGSDDTPVDGLVIRYEGATTGSVGDMTFSRGVGSLLEAVTDVILGPEEGGIDSIVERMNLRVDGMNDRIDRLEIRLEQRRETLIRKFTAVEEALAMAQSQAQWLSAQLGSLQPVNSKPIQSGR